MGTDLIDLKQPCQILCIDVQAQHAISTQPYTRHILCIPSDAYIWPRINKNMSRSFLGSALAGLSPILVHLNVHANPAFVMYDALSSSPNYTHIFGVIG